MKQEKTPLSEVYHLIEQDLFSEAIVLLEKYLDINTENNEAIYWLAYSFIQIHHPLAAIETLSLYKKGSKKEEHIEAALLIAYFDSVQFAKADNIASSGIQNFPLCPHFWRYKGFITARMEPQDATPFFDQAFSLSSKEYPKPRPLPDCEITTQIISWLPKGAKRWLQEKTIEVSLSPSVELLTKEVFPEHPLSPFLISGDTIHLFLQNLRYQPYNQTAKSALFEKLLSMWNHLK